MDEEIERIVETTKKAIELTLQPYDAMNIKFGKYQSIYMAPTGNVKDSMKPIQRS